MTSSVSAAFLALLFPLPALPQETSETSPFEPANFGVVYDVPAMAQVRVQKNVTYHRVEGRELQLDICTPPTARAPLPAVVFLNAIGDRLPDRVKEWGIYSSWPRLIAAQGMAGVSMDCDQASIQACLAAVFAFLEREGARFGIDGTRIGVYAASANVSEASRFLLRPEAPKNVKAAVFYYGWPDVPTARRDLPVLCVTAESDLAGSRERLLALWPQILTAGAPWTFELATDLPHAFDAFADNDASRRTIQRTIAFWKSHLEPVPQPSWKPSPERAILAAMYGHDEPRIVSLLGEWIAAHPDDPHGYATRGTTLARMRRGAQAKPDLEKALALGSDDPGVHGCLGMMLAMEGQNTPAVEHMRRAIEGNWYGSELYGHLGHALLVLGRDEEAVRAYEESIRIGIPPGAQTLGLANYNLACGYARLGRLEDALAAVERAVEQHFGPRRSYEADEDLKPLRGEERFQIAMDRLGTR
jgi:Flp pilus assembly protein TadD